MLNILNFLEKRIIITILHFYFLTKDFTLICIPDIETFQRCQNHPSGGNCVSDCLYKPSFLLYLKKREAFSVFFFFVNSRFHKIKTRTLNRNLRRISLHPGLNSMYGKFQWVEQIIQ